MANGKQPETEGEHIVAIYGHIEGLKKGHDVFDQNLNRVEGKLDKFENTWWVVGGLATLIATIIGILTFQ
jgi:hypothetical protein